MTNQNVKAQNVTMYPEDWGIVEAFAEQVASQTGTKNTSLSLRMIVREWAKLTGFQLPDPQGEKNAELALAA